MGDCRKAVAYYLTRSVIDRLSIRANLAVAHQKFIAQQPAPINRVEQIINIRQSVFDTDGKDAHTYAEIRRIINLAIVHPMTDEEVEEYSRQNVLASAYDGPEKFRLRPMQAEACAAYDAIGGLLGKIAVGEGKTLVSLLIASKAFAKGIRRMTLHVPPNVLDQLLETDIKWARSRIPMNYPIFDLSSKSSSGRKQIAQSGNKGLYIFPYSLLSAKDGFENLAAIKPELCIFDEVHYVSQFAAARTKRLFGEYGVITTLKPQVVGMSGSITKKSVNDYWHIARAALDANNPLPNSASLAREWGAVIDATAASDSGCETGPLLPLIGWAKKHYRAEAARGDFSESQRGFRKAYNKRLNSAPGSVSSGDSKLHTSLIYRNEPVKDYKKVDGWPELEALDDAIVHTWKTPSGDEIEHAIHTFKWRYELAAGFFNQLTWPQPEDYAVRHQGMSVEEAADILKRSQMHHAAKQDMAKLMRRFLQERARPKLDTPIAVYASLAQHGGRDVGKDMHDAYRFMKALEFDGMADRDPTAIQVCSFKIDAAVKWAASLPEGDGALLWVYHKEVGRWLVEAMKKANLNPLPCPAGDHANELLNLDIHPETARRKCVLSISAHKEGKNLQKFKHNYFVQWPRPNLVAEQSVGRTHRFGQTADELIMYRCDTTEFDEVVFASCVVDALYVHQTTNSKQKLIYGTHSPMPKMFPPEAMREKGFKTIFKASEDSEIRKAVADRFGDL